jgi:hypothetical protein
MFGPLNLFKIICENCKGQLFVTAELQKKEEH